MKIFLLITFFLLALILLPIYIKITLYFDNTTLKIKFFKKTIDINSIKKMIKEDEKIAKTVEETKDSLNVSSVSFTDIKLLIENLNKNKYKPKLKVNGDFKYGTNDAAITAILYGVIFQLQTVISVILNTTVDINDFSINVIPLYNAEIINGNILFQIKLNIFKIINLILIIKKSLHGKRKGFSPNKKAFNT